MRVANWKWFGLAVVAAVSFGMAGCASSQQSQGETAEAREAGDEHSASEAGGEHAMAEGGGEAARSGEGGEEHARSEGGREEGREEHARSEGRGEHGGEAGEGGGHDEAGGEGEESGVYIGRGETWDVVRRGARLILAFDPAANAFRGTVENTTEGTLCAIRVEVHLAGGIELGPTERTNLSAGHTTTIELSTEGNAFDSWTAHPEMSACPDD